MDILTCDNCKDEGKMKFPDDITAEELAKIMLSKDLSWHEPSIGFINASFYLDLFGWSQSQELTDKASKIKALIPAAAKLIAAANKPQISLTTTPALPCIGSEANQSCLSSLLPKSSQETSQ